MASVTIRDVRKAFGSVIVIHGGGWVAGNKAGMMGNFVARYLEKGFVVANVEYRLAAVAKAPASTALGATTVVLTAATGGIGQGLDTGHLVVGSDHINLLGQSPLRGWRRPDGSPPFVDMVGAYDDALAGLAVAAARNRGIPVSRGVYAAMPGPMYETPAEIGFLRTIGASVVGMSVVPEAVPARALGMRVLGLFFVTNQVGVEVRHEDVVRASDAMAGSIGEVIAEVLAKGAPWQAT